MSIRYDVWMSPLPVVSCVSLNGSSQSLVVAGASPTNPEAHRCQYEPPSTAVIEGQHPVIRSTWSQAAFIAGMIPGLRPANERRRYLVTTSLIGWAQAQFIASVSLTCTSQLREPSIIFFYLIPFIMKVCIPKQYDTYSNFDRIKNSPNFLPVGANMFKCVYFGNYNVIG